eukprot:335929-Alexandrium_andersonii.AAC.1
MTRPGARIYSWAGWRIARGPIRALCTQTAPLAIAHATPVSCAHGPRGSTCDPRELSSMSTGWATWRERRKMY